MRTTKYMNEEIMVKKGIKALIGELGPVPPAPKLWQMVLGRPI